MIRSREYLECKKMMSSVHKRIISVSKMLKSKSSQHLADELLIKKATYEKELKELQTKLKRIKRNDKKAKAKAEIIFKKSDSKHTAKKIAAVSQQHADSEYYQKKVSIVQGGAPGLGKGKS